jgi:hypothetical protein
MTLSLKSYFEALGVKHTKFSQYVQDIRSIQLTSWGAFQLASHHHN